MPDTADLIAQLEADAPVLAAAAAAAGWDAPVPGLDWTVRRTVAHTGAVHRWATDILTRRLASNETGGSPTFEEAVPDDELSAWFRDGHARLVAALRTSGDDFDTFRFYAAPSGRAFWARRQAHETAIHRVDVEAAAAGAATPFAPEFAQDGIDEMAVFARGRRHSAAVADAGPATLLLRVSDGPSRHIALGGERIETRPADPDERADAVVEGTSGDIYRWLWNRPSDVSVTGDTGVAARWRGVRIG